MQAAASSQAAGDHWRLGLEWIGCGVILAALHLLSGRASLAQRGLTASPWAGRLLFCLLFAAAFAVLHLPLTALKVSAWPAGVSIADALTTELTDDWISVPFQAAALFAALSLAAAWPRRWAAAMAGLAAALVFLMVLIAPLTLAPIARGDAPAPAGAGGALLDFVRRGGLHANRLYVFAGSDPTAVDMEGFLGATHAAVSREALLRPTPQTYAAIGHLLGHYRHGDLWGLTALWSLMAAALFAAMAVVHRTSAPPEGRAGPAPDGGRLAMLLLVAWACLPIFMIAFNVFDQVINYRADAYALRLTRDADGLCRWLVASDARTKADPSTLETLVFFDHPPLARRLDSVLRASATPP